MGNECRQYTDGGATAWPPWKGVHELALRAGGSGGKERGQARPAQNKSQDPPPAGSPNVLSGSSLLLNMVAHTYWD